MQITVHSPQGCHGDWVSREREGGWQSATHRCSADVDTSNPQVCKGKWRYGCVTVPEGLQPANAWNAHQGLMRQGPDREPGAAQQLERISLQAGLMGMLSKYLLNECRKPRARE